MNSRTEMKAYDERALQVDAAPGTDTATPTLDFVQVVQTITVTYEYPVIFTRDLFATENLSFVEAMRRSEPARLHRFLTVIDTDVVDAWPDLPSRIAAYTASHPDALSLVAQPVIVPGGEAAKNDLSVVEHIQELVHRHGIDRQSFIVCIGGGALQDAVGYAAATAHRGIRLIRVPTTVLSQNDSAVGVKNSVNAFGKKNFLGTFAPPYAVLNDVCFLETLGRRDQIAGMSEAVKVALIRDGTFYRWIEENAHELAACHPDALAYLIRRCAELHLDHIGTSGDPFEFGSARPLDFGHWAAHKLESLSAYRVRHGEAVAIGIALDTRYSAEIGALEQADAESVVELLERLGFRLWDEAIEMYGAAGRPRVMEGLSEFREHLGGELTITLLRGIGDGFEAHEIDETRMLAALNWLRRRDAAR